MKKKIIVWCLSFIAILSQFALAHPPNSMELNYGQNTKVLSIKAKHVSHKLDKHFIRKMEVVKNNEVVETVRFHRQTKPSLFSTEYVIDLKAGDSIEITLFCSKGGKESASLHIEPQEETESQDANE